MKDKEGKGDNIDKIWVQNLQTVITLTYVSPFSAPQNRQLMNSVRTRKPTRASFQLPLAHVSYNRTIFIQKGDAPIKETASAGRRLLALSSQLLAQYHNLPVLVQHQ